MTTDHEGEVSTILHDELNEGDKINLSAPVGPFAVANPKTLNYLLVRVSVLRH